MTIRWERVEGFLDEFGYSPQVENASNPHDYYIPENIFYRLCMKAKNEIAQSDISYYAIPGGNNRTYETALYIDNEIE